MAVVSAMQVARWDLDAMAFLALDAESLALVRRKPSACPMAVLRLPLGAFSFLQHALALVLGVEAL